MPALERIVGMSRLFGVTTDSLLVEGISNFAEMEPAFLCGVYRGDSGEIVETERFAYAISDQDGELSARLYMGSRERKKLAAVCVRRAGSTRFAYRTENGSVIATDDALSAELGAAFNRMWLGERCRREKFRVDHSGERLPTVSQAGIKRCLMAWRMRASLTANTREFQFFLCTGQTEYVMILRPQHVDVYCGASFNIPFDMGLMSGGQYFRMRNFGDNSEPWCGFHADFAYVPRQFHIPTEEIRLGLCVNTSEGMMWCVKRYTEEEIVLQGCGEDEYAYRRGDRRTEQFTLAQ